MADFMTPEQRKRCMAKIRGKGTAPELNIRKALWHAGFRYRLETKLPGKPDIVLKKHKVAIFVHGCFWHSHSGCQKSKLPTTRKDFWANKITANALRDKKNISALTSSGWRIAIVWECSLKNRISQEDTLYSLTKWIVSDLAMFESKKPGGTRQSPGH